MGATGDEGAQQPAARPGRRAGIPNRDKLELRALLQEKVHEFTELRHHKDIESGLPPHEAQEIIEEYDPVVALALVAVDRRSTLDQRIKCNAEVAQYVRPKLKSVELQADPEALEQLEQKTALSAKLVDLLQNAAADAKPPRKPPPTAPAPEAESK